MLKLAGKTQGAVISCNVSYKNRIDAPILVKLLAGGLSPSPEWLPHLDTFFNELPKDDIEGVMKENNLSVETLAAVFFPFLLFCMGKILRNGYMSLNKEAYHGISTFS